MTFVLLVAACSSAEIEQETYSIGDTTLIRTHCAAADPVLLSASADALPKQDQTETERVARILAESRTELLASQDGLDAIVAPRNGQVWANTAAGLRILDATDSLLLITIPRDGLCPVAPVTWNGIPLAFFRDGYLD